MLPDKSIGCHRTFGGLKIRSCYDMVTKQRCQLWVAVDGVNKNTGDPVKKHGCLDSLAHILHLETTSTVREAAGEISQHRRENREQATQAAQNAAALNDNLIQMHRQTTQVAIAQVKAIQSVASGDLPTLIEHRPEPN